MRILSKSRDWHKGLTVKRFLDCLMFGFVLAAPAWTQDVEEGDAVAEGLVDAEDEAADDVDEVEVVEEDEIDETGLDEQGFDNKDDDFRPTEEIPTDQSIPFPTDI